MKHFSNLSFKQKLAAAFFFAGIVPLILSLTIITLVFKDTILDESSDAIQVQFSSLNTSFSSYVNSIDSVLKSFISNEKIENVFENDLHKNLTLVLDTENEILQHKADIAFYSTQGKCIYSSSKRYYLYSMLPEDLFTTWGILRSARNKIGNTWYKCSADNPDNYAFQAAIAVRAKTNIQGYAVISVTKKNLDSLFEGKFNSNISIIIADQTWNPVYTTSESSEILTFFKNQFFFGKPVHASQNDSVYFIQKNEKSGFYFIMKRHLPVTFKTIRFFIATVVITILFSLALFAIFAERISSNFFEPIKNLNNAMILVEKGNLDIELKTKRIDELGQLIGRFNRTVRKLKQYMSEIINRQQELNNTQIRMMQAQLNPHFLYNTLDTIKWIAKINKLNTIATITTDLADILRFSITGDDLIPLSEELNLLEHYIEIQKIRFPDKFELVTKIEDGVRDFMIPKLMLQPLVENSIIHGFEEVNKGRITVTAEQIADEVIITVTDDGKGITQEAIYSVQSGKKVSRKGHLGLHNVDAILRLHFGQKYGLSFIPMETRGTWIRIILPRI